MTEKIREIARSILENGEVELVIGFEKGTIPLKSRPVFIEKPEEVEKLIWDGFCENNLATYLRRYKGRKVGIVAKGCDSRAIVNLIVEGQLNREDVYIIGVPCTGMYDRRKMIRDGKLEPSDDYLFMNCKTCQYPTPVLYDELVGEEVSPRTRDYSDVETIEKMSSDERWEWFQREFSRCIRCYACREACPMCFCEFCFVDENRPEWVEGGIHPSDLGFWNLGRAFHLAGRCVECGACERACPMELPLMVLNRKMAKDVKEIFDYEAGVSLDEKPVLGTFNPEDREDFIL